MSTHFHSSNLSDSNDENDDENNSSDLDDESGLITTNSDSYVNAYTKRPRSLSSSDDEAPPVKKGPYQYQERNIDQLAYSVDTPVHDDNKGRSMLQKMGYRPGQGLGKHSQGRVEPVEISKQRGRRGLGLKLPGLDPADLHWDSTHEVVDVKEEVSWLNGSTCLPLELDLLRSWKKEGSVDHHIENMTDFCAPSLVKNILKGKTIFDSLNADELIKARSRSNPFETLKNGMFLNRAALKMANIDAIYNYMFTSPKKDNGEDVVGKDELLYFADVCAGPGGFSEYVLWRSGWKCKGFGFTLRGECDFKLGDFFAGSPETFEAYYGVKDDGDVFNPDNINSLRELVLNGTESKGVHFMMADGGFSVEGQENIQELLSKQLYLCQFLVALNIVMDEGHFVCKLFDVFSPFSVGLIYLMYRAFSMISIFKPNTSRPANSERYIICKCKRSDSASIRDYMFEINERLIDLKLEDPSSDITHLVPMDILMDDNNFYEYIVSSNNRLGERQIINLLKVATFCRDPNLREDRQASLRRQCLAAWKIPDNPRSYDRSSPEEVSKKILSKNIDIVDIKVKPLVPGELKNLFGSIFDWHCVSLGSKEAHFYLGLGRNKIYQWNNRSNKWVRDSEVKAQLSPGTLVYGEVVPELKGESVSLVKMNALHIIDGVSVGYQNISSLHWIDRLKILNLYCKALQRVQGGIQFPVRVKELFPFYEVNNIFRSLTYRLNKGMKHMLVIENDEFSFQPKGIMFINSSRPPWIVTLSKRTSALYCFNTTNGKSLHMFNMPIEAKASVKECLQKAFHWQFDEGVGLQLEDPVDGVLHKDALLEFINGEMAGYPHPGSITSTQ